MTKPRFIPVLLGVLLLLAGFAAGRLSVPAPSGGSTPTMLAAGRPSPDPAGASPLPVATYAIPVLDVPGADIAGLPPFPGATRVEYRQRLQDTLFVTEAEYVTTADFEDVHNYYRNLFSAEGWLVADLSFYQGEWTFFVISGGREALVEIESRGPLVEVEIEISEPQGVPTLVPATNAPATLVPPTAVPATLVPATNAPATLVPPTAVPPTLAPALADDDDDGGSDGGADDNDDGGGNGGSSGGTGGSSNGGDGGDGDDNNDDDDGGNGGGDDDNDDDDDDDD